MTNLANRRSYNLGDTFGEPVEADSGPTDSPVNGSWCNLSDVTFEQDDAAREQGGAA